MPKDVPRLSDILNGTSHGNGASMPASKGTASGTSRAVQKQATPFVKGSQQRAKAPRKPWQAGYYTSTKTQDRIKNAASRAVDQRLPPIGRATAVLKALLSTPAAKCNGTNLICALTMSAKAMGRETNQEFRSLLVETIDILRQLIRDEALSARQLCNAAWAIAKHYDRDQELLPVARLPNVTADLTEVIKLDLSSDSPDSPAQRVDHAVDEIATQLTSVLRESAVAAKEGELSMASWAYGVLRPRQRPPGWMHEPKMGEIPTKAVDKESDFILFERWESDTEDDEDVSAPASVTDELFDAIAKSLVEPRDSSEGSTDGHLRVRTCRWSELANIAWAFASHGRSCSEDSQELLVAIAGEAGRRLRENGADAKRALSRDVAQLVWALGTLQADNFKLGDGLVDLVDAVSSFTKVGPSSAGNTRPLMQWNCPDIVQMTLSLSHARIDELPLLRALYEEALIRLQSGIDTNPRSGHDRQSFRAWEVSILLWAQARLFLKAPQGDVFTAFQAEAVDRLHAQLKSGNSPEDRLGSQEQANVAWALTVLEEHESPQAIELVRTIFDDAVVACEKNGVMQLEHAHQLWQSYFLLEESSPDIVKDVPRWFRDYLQDRWVVEKARRKLSSARHRSLSQVLNLMGVAHYNEHDEDIDVAIVLKQEALWTHETTSAGKSQGVKVAVEFDGPNHFTRMQAPIGGEKRESPRALGHTVLKYRLLKKEGWTVVRVPYFEWDLVPHWASMERQRYLQRLLKTHANLKFSSIDVSEYKAPVPRRSTRFD